MKEGRKLMPEVSCRPERGRVSGPYASNMHFTESALIHPNQRCGYSDSPFARKDTFLYCRVWKWLGGGGGAVVEASKS